MSCHARRSVLLKATARYRRPGSLNSGLLLAGCCGEHLEPSMLCWVPGGRSTATCMECILTMCAANSSKYRITG
jgi:hypothetical protein